MRRIVAAVEPLGQPEIRHMRLALLVHQHIRRLQVSMQNAAAMGMVHCLRHGAHQPGGGADRRQIPRAAGRDWCQPPASC